MNGELVSTVCGVVQRVNKLVSVAPLAGRYNAQLGDVLVGRVAEIIAQRWKLDICAQQDAILQLSAVNLPGSAQVKSKTSGIEHQCCCPWIKLLTLWLDLTAAAADDRRRVEHADRVFRERTDHRGGPVTVCRPFSRSAHAQCKVRAGKCLKAWRIMTSRHHVTAADDSIVQAPRGQLVRAPAGLLRRRKQQLVRAEELHVNITLGLNGYIFVSPDSSAAQSSVSRSPPEQHRDVARAAAAVRVLAALGASVDVNAVSSMSRTAADAQLEPDRMLQTASLRTFKESLGEAHD